MKKKKIIMIVSGVIIVIAIAGAIIVKIVNDGKAEVIDERYAKREDQSDEAEFEKLISQGTMEEPESYTANVEYTENTSLDGETIESTGFEENAILASNGANVNLKNMTIIRNAADSDDETGAKRFGIGAAVLAKNAIAILSNCNITTTGKGSTGIFAYGKGVISIFDSTIVTNSNNSGGIHAANGGTVIANNVTVTTYGENSAGIRSESDGQVMEIEGGSYTTNGQDSPAVYSIATVNVKDAVLTANNSEAAYIDGGHSITLENCTVTSKMMSVYQRYNYNDKALVWTIGIGQTTKKDESSIGNFKMIGGSLTSNNGGLFYTSNTTANILLKDVDITPSENSDFFLKCTGNHNTVEDKGTWGELGANGATCNFTAISQEMEGDVMWDSISNLDFYMTEGSILTGAVIDDESAVEGTTTSGVSGHCDLIISNDSKWVVTGDSTLSTLSNAGTIVDKDGKKVTIKGTNGTTYVTGNSSYTITVDRYVTTADLQGALTEE